MGKPLITINGKGLIQAIQDSLQTVRQPGGTPPDQFREAFQVRWSKVADQKQRNFAQAFHTNPGFDSLNLIAQDVAQAVIALYDKRQYKADSKAAKPIKEHELLNLLDDPCPGHKEIDGFMLKYMTAVYLNINGEFFWVVGRDAKGTPNSLYPVLPTWVVQTWSVTMPFYRILPQGSTSYQELLVNGNDIVWFKNPNMVDPFGRGRGRDEAIGDELEADEYAAKYQKNLFFNDGQPPMIITMPEGTQETANILKESWVQKVAGWINARKPMFTNTKVDVLKLTDSVREMDMVESRKALRDIFNQHYALPPEMRGILENSNRSTIDSADYLYKKNVLSRQIRRFVDILNRQLVPMFDERLILVCDDVVPQDETEKKAQALKDFQAGVLTENEYRQIIGYATAPDGDIRLRPANVKLVLKNEGNKRELIEPPKSPQLNLDIEEPKKHINLLQVKSILNGQFDKRIKHWEDFDIKAFKAEDGFKTATKLIAVQQKEELTKWFKEYISDGENPEMALEKATVEVYGTDALNKSVFRQYAPAWAKTIKDGFEIADQALGGGVSFDLYNTEFSIWVKEHGMSMAKEINGTTKAELMALAPKIQASMESGQSIDKISDTLNHVYDKLGTTRADLIARTETMASINYGQFATYRGEGVTKKEWMSTPSPNARGAHKNDKTNHLKMDGQIIGIDELFTGMGESEGMLYPGDPSGGASNNCNCRCTVLPVI